MDIGKPERIIEVEPERYERPVEEPQREAQPERKTEPARPIEPQKTPERVG